MAVRTTMTVTKTCDLSREWLGQEVPATVSKNFSVDGKDYVLDLCEAYADELDNALAQFKAAARRVKPTAKRKYTKRAVVSDDSGSGRKISVSIPSSLSISSISAETISEGSNGEVDSTKLREWAAANGWEVSERGRIRNEVKQAYLEWLGKHGQPL
jgi:hypothetical protein